MEQKVHNPFKSEVNFKPNPEKVMTVSEAHDYLEARGFTGLCRSEFECDSEKIEQTLGSILLHLRHNAQTAKKIDELNYLRGVLRATSIIHHAPKLRASQDEAFQYANTRHLLDETSVTVIKEAFDELLVGESVEKAVRCVEDLYFALQSKAAAAETPENKQELHADIIALQPLRNILYLRRIHPTLGSRLMTMVVYDNRRSHAA